MSSSTVCSSRAQPNTGLSRDIIITIKISTRMYTYDGCRIGIMNQTSISFNWLVFGANSHFQSILLVVIPNVFKCYCSIKLRIMLGSPTVPLTPQSPNFIPVKKRNKTHQNVSVKHSSMAMFFSLYM